MRKPGAKALVFGVLFRSAEALRSLTKSTPALLRQKAPRSLPKSKEPLFHHHPYPSSCPSTAMNALADPKAYLSG
jgi:hypothetical protein